MMALLRLSLVCVLVVFTIACHMRPHSPPPAPPVANAQQEVQIAEQKWLEAYYRLDVAKLAASETEDFILVLPAMIVPRGAQLGSDGLSSNTPPAVPAPFALTRQTITVYRDFAVVVDVCTVSQSGGQPVTSPGTYWQTESWHKEDGTWKISLMHISPVEHGM
jgi:ketosteroid isomerase-like protein